MIGFLERGSLSVPIRVFNWVPLRVLTQVPFKVSVIVSTI